MEELLKQLSMELGKELFNAWSEKSSGEFLDIFFERSPVQPLEEFTEKSLAADLFENVLNEFCSYLFIIGQTQNECESLMYVWRNFWKKSLENVLEEYLGGTVKVIPREIEKILKRYLRALFLLEAFSDKSVGALLDVFFQKNLRRILVLIPTSILGDFLKYFLVWSLKKFLVKQVQELLEREIPGKALRKTVRIIPKVLLGGSPG